MTRRDYLQLAFLPGVFLASACSRKKSPVFHGWALIANAEGRSLSVIDLSRFQQIKEIPLGAAPSWVITTPTAGRAFVGSAESNFLEVLNLDTLQREHRVAIGGKPQAACLSTDGRSLWLLLHEADLLTEWDIAAGKQVSRIALPSRGARLDVNGNTAVVSFPEDKRVGRMTSQGALTLSPRLDHSPLLMKLRSDNEVALVGNADHQSMTVVHVASMAPISELPLALQPQFFCMNRDGGQLFITGSGMDSVVIVSPFQTEVGETILAGAAPGAMATTTSGPQYLLVANRSSGDLTVIDVESRRMLAQIPVGQKPGTVLVTPDNEFALILNEQSCDMAVIRLMAIRTANRTARRSRTAPLFTLLPVGSRPIGGSIAPRLT